MKLKVLISIVITIFIYSCNDKNGEKVFINKTMSYNEKIKSILIKQIKAGNDEAYGSYSDYDKNDFDASVTIVDSTLKENGYKYPTSIHFNDIIKEVFGRIIDNTSENQYLKIETFEENKCDKKLKYSPFSADNQYLYAVKGKFITNFHPLPRVMDYLKEFPDVAAYEKDDIIIEDKIEGVKARASQWKDNLKYLSEMRYNINLKLINRNKYLFNDSKASLVWLKFNDQEFLESLVKTFGYAKDQDLLKWVLDINLNDEEFDKVLFTKTCDNKYVFHKEIFEIMNKTDKKNKEKYIAFLKEHFPKIDKNNFSDEKKIQALYCYYSTKLSGSISLIDVYGFFPRLNDEESELEFKKNNYYNLPDFKELYNETRYSGLNR